MDIDAIFGSFIAELTDGLEKGERFDIADRAADFHNDDLDLFFLVAAGENPGFNFISNMRDNLNGFSKIVTFAFSFDDRFVNLSRCGIGGAGEGGVGIAVVVAKVEVGFGAVVSDIDFAVLERVHRSRVDVEIGVEFEHGDFNAAALEKLANRG